MSSSYRNVARARLAILCGLGAVAVAQPARAAQTYVQPFVDLRFEANDNWDLEPKKTDNSDVYGYIVELKALIGLETPRGGTSIRPRLVLREYPDRSDINTINGYLDLVSTYRWETSDLYFLAKYSHEDLYDAQLPPAGFDPLNPNDPAIPDTGRILVGNIRDRFDVAPTFNHQLTERVKVGANLSLESARYDTNRREDYDFSSLGGNVKWSVGPRAEVGMDAYGSRYRPANNLSDTDAYGVGASFTHQYSEKAGVEGRVFFEENKVTDSNSTVAGSDTSTSGWGGNVTAYRAGPTSDWRFTLEQGFWPSGQRGKTETSQFRVQYQRAVTERLNFAGAARYLKERALGGAVDLDDRDYATLELSLQRFMSPTWYVSGGYSYVWQKYVHPGDPAANNQVFISVGYQGLDRKAR